MKTFMFIVQIIKEFNSLNLLRRKIDKGSCILQIGTDIYNIFLSNGEPLFNKNICVTNIDENKEYGIEIGFLNMCIKVYLNNTLSNKIILSIDKTYIKKEIDVKKEDYI